MLHAPACVVPAHVACSWTCSTAAHQAIVHTCMPGLKPWNTQGCVRCADMMVHGSIQNESCGMGCDCVAQGCPERAAGSCAQKLWRASAVRCASAASPTSSTSHTTAARRPSWSACSAPALGLQELAMICLTHFPTAGCCLSWTALCPRLEVQNLPCYVQSPSLRPPAVRTGPRLTL
jgi:hypothetical protein